MQMFAIVVSFALTLVAVAMLSRPYAGCWA